VGMFVQLRLGAYGFGLVRELLIPHFLIALTFPRFT